MQSAVRPAAQAFLAMLPPLMTVAAFAPHHVRNLPVDSLSAVLGVRQGTLDEVRRTFQTTGTPLNTVGAAGVVPALVTWWWRAWPPSPS